MKRTFGIFSVLLVALFQWIDPVSASPPLEPLFTYQGRLLDQGAPINGPFDVKITVWDALVGGTLLADPAPATVTAADGHFTTDVDFGTADVFDGNQRWLEISIKLPGEEQFTTLHPRQPIRPAPYSVFATNGGGDGGWTSPMEGTTYFDGSVGIGTSAPSSALSVVGGMNVDHGGENDGTVFDNALRFGDATTGEGISSKRTAGGNQLGLDFHTGFLPRMSISNTGNVGVGTSSPQNRLHVVGDGAANGTFNLQTPAGRAIRVNEWADLSAGTGGAGLFGGNGYINASDNTWRFANDHGLIGVSGLVTNGPWWNSVGIFANPGPATAHSEFTPNWVATFRDDGRVGIGTIEPSARLQVAGDLAVDEFRLGGAAPVLGPPNVGMPKAYIKGDGGDPALFLESTSAFGNREMLWLRSHEDLSIPTLTPPFIRCEVIDDDDGTTETVFSVNSSRAFTRRLGVGTPSPLTQVEIQDGTLRLSGASSLGQDTARLVIDTGASWAHSPMECRNANGVLFKIFGSTNRTQVKVLEITGGADLSEPFDIRGSSDEIAPGMVVCIDPENPGDLVLSNTPYDRTVAGVISGAGGVEPGMIMGQRESEADGEHPVALTGRVYVWCDATKAPIGPGDLLTTSERRGHATKVIEHDRAQGAILGKAMSDLDDGQGLVLVLVSLQ